MPDQVAGYDEFRVVLTPLSQAAAAGGEEPPPVWRVTLVSGPTGYRGYGPMGEIRPPAFTRADLERLRAAVEHNDLGEGDLGRIGESVWRSLFTPELSQALTECWDIASSRHRGLRITVAYNDTEEKVLNKYINLSELPIELMRNPARAEVLPDYPGRDEKFTISRGFAPDDKVPGPELLKPIPVPAPLRALVVVAAPKDLPNTQSEGEVQAIKEALRGSAFDDRGRPRAGGKVEMRFLRRAREGEDRREEVLGPPTLDRLNKALQEEGPWHLLHFIGHGTFQPPPDDPTQVAHVYFETDDGDEDPVSASRLAPILDTPDLKLVILTACSSSQPLPERPRPFTYPLYAFDGVAHRLLRKTRVGAVVAMQFDFEDQAAPIFSKKFYGQFLIDKNGLDSVVSSVRRELNRIPRLGRLTWATPTLYWHPRDGHFFEIVGELSENEQRDLAVLEAQVAAYRTAIGDLEEFRGKLAGDVKGRLQPLVDRWQANLKKAMDRRVQILGNTVFLSYGQGSPGEVIEVNLGLRARADMAVKRIDLNVTYPNKSLLFQPSDRGIQLDEDNLIVQETPGRAGSLTIRFEVGKERPWPGGPDKIYSLGVLKFKVLDAALAGVEELQFKEIRIDPKDSGTPDTLPGLVHINSNIKEYHGVRVAELGGGQASVGDLISPTPLHEIRSGKRPVVVTRVKRWPNRTISYIIDPSIAMKHPIEEAIRHYKERARIQFVPYTAGTKDYIRFVASTGCASEVGMRGGGGEQPVYLGAGCETLQIIHELGHTLGLFHEHCRPDRDKYVRIVYENMMPGTQPNFDKFREQDAIYDLGPYDVNSIMHFGPTTFSVNNQPTIVVREPFVGVIGNRFGFLTEYVKGLSERDIQKIDSIYSRS